MEEGPSVHALPDLLPGRAEAQNHRRLRDLAAPQRPDLVVGRQQLQPLGRVWLTRGRG